MFPQYHSLSSSIFVVGFNQGYTDVKERISGVISFVSGAPLRPVKSDVDEHLSHWYKDNSRVYVAADHACWQDADYARKVSKRRFGTVIKSTHVGLATMMKEHSKDVKEWILARSSGEGEHGDTTEDDRMS